MSLPHKALYLIHMSIVNVDFEAFI
ncbi:hypothetical protein ALT785_240173 [Alteromonas infernus]